jgi:N12 class adenine-specific DNA methylase
MPLDIIKARQAGYSDDEIADYLNKEREVSDLAATYKRQRSLETEPRIDFATAGRVQRPAAEGLTDGVNMYPAGITADPLGQDMQNQALAPRIPRPTPVVESEQQSPDLVAAFNLSGISDRQRATSGYLEESPVVPTAGNNDVGWIAPGSPRKGLTYDASIATPRGREEAQFIRQEYGNKPILTAATQAAETVSLLSFPVASAFDNITGNDAQKERIAGNIEDLQGFKREQAPSEKVGPVGKFIRTGEELATGIAAMGPAAGITFPAQAFTGTALDSLDQGIDPTVASARGILSAAATTAMMAVPLAGKSVVQGISRGVAFNPALGIAERTADKAILEGAGYDQAASEVNPFGAGEISHDALMGVLFSLHQNVGKSNRTIPTERGDVAVKKPWTTGDAVEDFIPFGDIAKSSWSMKDINSFFAEELKPVKEGLKERGWSAREINDYILNKFKSASADAKAKYDAWRAEQKHDTPTIETANTEPPAETAQTAAPEPEPKPAPSGEAAAVPITSQHVGETVTDGNRTGILSAAKGKKATVFWHDTGLPGAVSISKLQLSPNQTEVKSNGEPDANMPGVQDAGSAVDNGRMEVPALQGETERKGDESQPQPAATVEGTVAGPKAIGLLDAIPDARAPEKSTPTAGMYSDFAKKRTQFNPASQGLSTTEDATNEVPKMREEARQKEQVPPVRGADVKQPWEMDDVAWFKHAEGGKLHQATGKSIPGEDQVKNPVVIGRMNGYPEQDIAHFYAAREGAFNGLGGNDLMDAVERAYEAYKRDALEANKNTPGKVSKTDKWEEAQKEVNSIYPTIKELKKPESNHIVMDIQTMHGGQSGKKIAAPYDGTEKDALRVAKALKLYASEEFNASMRESAVFATGANAEPVYAFTQGEGVTEIHKMAQPDNAQAEQIETTLKPEKQEFVRSKITELGDRESALQFITEKYGKGSELAKFAMRVTDQLYPETEKPVQRKDGEPKGANATELTVYHGSYSKTPMIPDSNGNIYYSTSKKTARLYGKVSESTISVNNPMVVDAGGKLKGEWGNYDEVIDEARSNGNDAVIVKNVIDVPSDIEEGYYRDRLYKFKSDIVIPIKTTKDSVKPQEVPAQEKEQASTISNPAKKIHPVIQEMINRGSAKADKVTVFNKHQKDMAGVMQNFVRPEAGNERNPTVNKTELPITPVKRDEKAAAKTDNPPREAFTVTTDSGELRIFPGDKYRIEFHRGTAAGTDNIPEQSLDDIAKKYAEALGSGTVNTLHKDFAVAIVNKDAAALRYLANGLNDVGKRVFSEVTGVPLPRQQSKTWDTLMEWGGIDPQQQALQDEHRQAGRAWTRAAKDLEALKNGAEAVKHIDSLIEQGFNHYHEVKTGKAKISAYLSKADDLSHGHLLNPKGQPEAFKAYAKAAAKYRAAEASLGETPQPKPEAEKSEPETHEGIAIGHEWDSPYGRQRFARVDNDGPTPMYVVETVDKPGEIRNYRHIAETVKRDEYALTPEYQTEQEQRKETARKNQEAAEQKAAADAKTDSEIAKFTEGMSTLAAGKARAALLKRFSFDGKEMSRKEMIEQRIAKGYRVTGEEGSRRFETADGSGLDEKTIGKTAMEYAEYLSNETEESLLSEPAKETEVVDSLPAPVQSEPQAEKSLIEQEADSLDAAGIADLIHSTMEEEALQEPSKTKETKPATKRAVKMGETTAKKRTAAAGAKKKRSEGKPISLVADAAREAGEGFAESFKGLAAAFGVDESKLVTFPPHLDPDAYEKARPHFQSAWEHYKTSGKSLKEFIQYLVRTLGQYIKNFADYLGYFIGEMKGTENFEKDMAERDTIKKKAEGTAHDDTRTAGEQSEEALARVPTGNDQGTGRGRDVRAERSGSGENDHAGNRGPENEGVSRPRSGRGRAPVVHPEKAGSQPLTSEQAASAPANVPAVNFVITPDLGLGKGGEVAKFNDNIAAINILKTLGRENRRATPEEQKALAKYVGWGGLANAFRGEDGKHKPDWRDRGEQLESLLTPAELKAARRSTRNAHYTSESIVRGMWGAVQRMGFKNGIVLEPSVGTGNFVGMTPEGVNPRFVGVEYDSLTARIATALYPQSAVLHSGFQKLAIPDGAFDLAIGNPPFGSESLSFQYKPELKGLSIHNQFFIASMDALKPGGVQAMVVSRYLMDAQDSTARLELAQRAKLLGAVRLPDTAFKENARTEVVTDIIFLQKLTPEEQRSMKDAVQALRSRPEKNADDERARLDLAAQVPEWVNTIKLADPLGGEDMVVNRYFAENRHMVVGVLERSGSMRGSSDITVRFAGKDFDAQLNEALQRLPRDIIKNETPLEAIEKRHTDLVGSLQIGLEGLEHGSIVFNRNGQIEEVIERETPEGGYEFLRRPLNPDASWSDRLIMGADGKWFTVDDQLDAEGNKVKLVDASGKETKRNAKVRNTFESEADIPATMRLGQSRYERLVSLIGIRDLLKRQIILETEDSPAADMDSNREKLNKAYDDFVSKHGLLNSPKNEGLISDMPDGALIVALENNYKPTISKERAKKLGELPREESADKAPILSKRVVIPYEPPSKAASPADALIVTMAESGQVDLDRLAALLGTDHDGVIKLLHNDMTEPLIFFDPELKSWQTRDQYLSGQVKRKLLAAQETGVEKNIAALEAVQPEPWTADKVTAIISGTWIPVDVYESFIEHLTGERGKVVFSAITNSFSADVPNTAKAADYKTAHTDLPYLLNQMLNSMSIKATTKDADGNTIFLADETALANMNVKRIHEEFSDWVFADGDRRRRLVDIFNEKFNVRVQRQYDGSHLFLPGKVPDIIISMRRHQKNAIWRGIQERFTLYDHAVGAGKTFTAIARAMERRRMGLSRKPMIVVPNHMVEQFASDVYRLYPGAKMLAAGKKDFDTQNRRRLFAKIATGDWDIVIVPHSSFKFISISPEAEERYLEKEIQLAKDAIAEAEEQAAEDGHTGWRKPFNVKQAEALAEKLETRMAGLKAKKHDRLLTFEQLGVDDLTVDEAHEFKNLFYSSRMSGVRGMGDRSGSEKAYDLYQKVRVLRDSPTGSVTFMTGTPISNSAVEMYTMMRYLAADELKEQGLEHFDAWRAQYVDASTAWEPTESGRLKEVTRLGRSWSNMRSLMDLYYSFTDAVSIEDIQRWYEEDNNGQHFPIPKVKGGTRTKVIVQPTQAQKDLLQGILDGFDGLDSIENPNERNAARLRLMDRARKVSLDARAVDPSLDTKEVGGKLQVVSEQAKRIYDQWNEDKGTQLIFLDRSVPKSKGDDKILKQYDGLITKRDDAMRRGDEAAYMAVVEDLEKYDANEMEELRRAQTGGWNAYQQIKDNLVAMGIPAKEIRFVQEATTDVQKQALFDAVRGGEIRILIGSTPRMGAGTNVQDRLVALHHVDVTWKPSDIEQREGRIVRQGNKLLEKYGEDFEVEILPYATELTVDAKMWSLNSTKLKTINGIRKYSGEFNMDFEDEESVSMSEIAALASGNPLMLERVKLDSEINQLEMLRRGWNRQAMALNDRIDEAQNIIADYPEKIEQAKHDAEAISQALDQVITSSAGKAITVEGTKYNTRIDAAKAISAEVERQQDGNEKARYSVNVDGEQLTSKMAIEDALEHAYGDVEPFSMTIGKVETAQRKVAAKELATIANDIVAKMDRDAAKTMARRVGSWLGMQLEVDVANSWGDLVAEVSLVNGDKKTVLTERGKRILRKEAKSEGAFSPQYFRALLNDAERSLSQLASGGSARYYENRLAAAEKDMPQLQEQAATKKEFPKQQELEDKRARLEEVITLLSDKQQAPEEEGVAEDTTRSAQASSSVTLDMLGLQQAYERLANSSTARDGAEALRQAGAHFYAKGNQTWREWRAAMKEFLGKLFKKFAGMLEKLYRELKADAKWWGQIAKEEIDNLSADMNDIYGKDLKQAYLKGKGLYQRSPLNNERGSFSIKKATGAEDDIIPAMKAAGVSLVKSWDSVLRVFAPASRAPVARRTALNLRELGSKKARRLDQIAAAIEPAREYFDRHGGKITDPASKSFQFIRAVELGEIDSLPKIEQPFARLNNLIFDRLLQEIQKRGRLLSQKTSAQKMEDMGREFEMFYFPRLWKDPKEATNVLMQLASKRPFEGRKAFMKQRTIQVFEDGIRAGLIPAYDNPMDFIYHKAAEMEQWIMARDWIDGEMREGRIIEVPAGHRSPEGWAQLDDRMGTIWGGSNVPAWKVLQEIAKTGKQDLYLADFAREAFPSGLAVAMGADDTMKQEANDLVWHGRDGKTYNIHAMKRGSGKSYSVLVLEKMLEDQEDFQRVAPTIYAKIEDIANNSAKLQNMLDTPTFENLQQKLPVGGMIVKAHLYAPEPSAKVFNNLVSQGLRGNDAFRAYLGAANVLNQFQLGLSLFHAGFTSVDAAVSSTALGVIQASHGDVLKAIRSFMEFPIAPVTNAIRGHQMIKEWNTPGAVSNPLIPILIEAAQAGGARAQMDRFYHTEIAKKMMQAFRSGNIAGGVVRIPFATMERASKPILEWLVPRQKMGIIAQALSYALEHNPNMTHTELQEVAAEIVDSVDNRMGQLIYDNLFWDKVAKDLGMASVRSLGWNVGTIRELGGGMIDVPTKLLIGEKLPVIEMEEVSPVIKKYRELKELPEDNSLHSRPAGRKRRVSNRAAYMIALPIMAGVMGALFQYLSADGLLPGEDENNRGKFGGPAEILKDLYYPRNGTIGANGRMARSALPSYMKDVFHYWKAPLTTITNKLHPALSIVAEMIKNKDFYGTELRHEDDPIVKQAGQVLAHVGKSFEPFAVRGYRQNSEQGASMTQKLMPFIGITPAPSDVNKTAAEKLADEMIRDRMPQGARTQDQFDRSKEKQKVERALRAKDPAASDMIMDVRARGLFNDRQLKDMRQEAERPNLYNKMKHLDWLSALKVYEVATPEERDTVNKLMRDKELNFKQANPIRWREIKAAQQSK